MNIVAAMLVGLASAVAAVADPEAALPDPTRPYAFAVAIEVDQDVAERGVQWRLSGVRLRDGERTAILNGHVVKAGDRLGAAMVIEVNPAEVVLEQESQRIVVKLVLSGVKKPVRNVAREESAED